LFLGLIGCAFLVRYHRWKNKDTSEPDSTPPDHHQDW
jgi:hypothetical protein